MAGKNFLLEDVCLNSSLGARKHLTPPSRIKPWQLREKSCLLKFAAGPEKYRINIYLGVVKLIKLQNVNNRWNIKFHIDTQNHYRYVKTDVIA